MKIYLWFWNSAFVITGFILGSCGSGTETGQGTEDIANTSNYFKTLLVIGDDRSGSTNDIRKLTEQDYKTLFNAVSEKGGGAVAVSLIGNPLAQNREPWLLSLQALEKTQPYDPNDTKLTLTEKSGIKLKNDKTLEANKSSFQANLGKINNFVDSIIKQNVILYKPQGIDHTNLNDAIGRINTLINEPGYRDYENIIVVFVSDGRNQPGSGERPITSKLTHPATKVFLVGWETSDSCFEVKTIDKFAAKEGMIEVIKNLK